MHVYINIITYISYTWWIRIILLTDIFDATVIREVLKCSWATLSKSKYHVIWIFVVKLHRRSLNLQIVISLFFIGMRLLWVSLRSEINSAVNHHVNKKCFYKFNFIICEVSVFIIAPFMNSYKNIVSLTSCGYFLAQSIHWGRTTSFEDICDRWNL